MKKVLIIGATSAIATATARLFASQHCALFLAARNDAALAALADDLRVRGASRIEIRSFEAGATQSHGELVDGAFTALDGLDIAILAYGSLPDQQTIQNSSAEVVSELQTNFVSMASLLTLLATRFESQGRGTLVAISSVAGDRGRAVNYVYGSAKAGLSTFMSGLRQRLWQKGVHVITVKPGFVDTPMTAGFRKGPLWARPESVAAGIVTAIESNRPEVYLPWYWRLIMLIIRLIPERIFVRLRF